MIKLVSLLIAATAGVSAPAVASISAPEIALPNDQQIIEHLSRKLSNMMSVSDKKVHIAAKSGTVILSGEVPNLKTRARIVALSESVRGINAVIDEITLKPYHRSFDQIANDIRKALSLDGATHNFKIQVSVNGSGVTLRGTVDSLAEKYLASWVADGVRGVKAIGNEILVVPPKSRSSREIAQDVNDELKKDPFVNEKLITVKVDGSKVIMSGVIPSLSQRHLLFKDALVAGVTEIGFADLKVDPKIYNPKTLGKLPRNDDEIQVAAGKAIALDPRLNGLKIHVDVNDNVGTLSGTVGNFRAQYVADDDVKNTIGITGINDRLTIGSSKTRSDDEVNTDIVDVLAMDPLLDAFPIDTHVKNGIVTISGNVDTNYEKEDAYEEVSLIDGVKGIRDEIGLYQHRPKIADAPDSNIKTSIDYYIRNDPNMNFGDQINVVVKHGKAVLEGNVLSWPDSFEAVEDAFDGGPIAVINKIKVNGQESTKIKEFPSMPREVYSYQWPLGSDH